MVILCADMNQVYEVIEKSQKIPLKIEKHWPGKLTVVLFKNESVYDIISANRSTVGVRIPGNDISLKLLRKHGPMVVTSLNVSNEPAITKFKDVLTFQQVVDYIVEGPDLNSLPSTVYDLTRGIVLRQGEIIL